MECTSHNWNHQQLMGTLSALRFVAQLDRASAYMAAGRRFESYQIVSMLSQLSWQSKAPVMPRSWVRVPHSASPSWLYADRCQHLYEHSGTVKVRSICGQRQHNHIRHKLDPSSKYRATKKKVAIEFDVTLLLLVLSRAQTDHLDRGSQSSWVHQCRVVVQNQLKSGTVVRPTRHIIPEGHAPLRLAFRSVKIRHGGFCPRRASPIHNSKYCQGFETGVA